MFHVSTIKNWFKGKAADFNKIAEYLNNLCGSGSVIVSRPDKPSNGSPPTISIDIEKLKNELGFSFPEEPIEPEVIFSGVADEAKEETIEEVSFTGKNNGAILLMLSRAHTESEEAIILYFRPVTIAKDGRICKIGAESDGIAVYPGML